MNDNNEAMKIIYQVILFFQVSIAGGAQVINMIIETWRDFDILLLQSLGVLIAMPTCMVKESLVEIGDSVSEGTVCIRNRFRGRDESAIEDSFIRK